MLTLTRKFILAESLEADVAMAAEFAEISPSPGPRRSATEREPGVQRIVRARHGFDWRRLAAIFKDVMVHERMVAAASPAIRLARRRRIGGVLPGPRKPERPSTPRKRAVMCRSGFAFSRTGKNARTIETLGRSRPPPLRCAPGGSARASRLGGLSSARP